MLTYAHIEDSHEMRGGSLLLILPIEFAKKYVLATPQGNIFI